ncbi:hypothetical protein ACHAW6_003388 [Cyclotella cf. meneghiniana]
MIEQAPILPKHSNTRITDPQMATSTICIYVGDDNLHHLTAILREHYKISIDKIGSQFVGICLDWDYK